ncbi:MAG TPA: ABC-2 family transporter protein [Opitutaceae bacterium]|nr:ABC-2 family transporter protein [Opitutaceae bacterium]
MPALAKYRHSFFVGLQSNLVYRWNFALRGGFSVFHLTVVFILWSAAYAGNTHIGGFDLAQTLTYFVILILLQFFVGAFNEDYQISEDIRNGLINQFLLKPINYFLYRLSVFSAARIVSGLLVLVPLGLALPLLWPYLAPPHEAWRLALGLPAALLSALIQFTIAYCFGLLTFWFLEIQSFILLSLAVETVLGGQMFPLDLMPPALFHLSQYLPYFYQMYFPAAILTGRVDFAGALSGLVIQCAWALILLGAAQLLWVRGLRRHTAVGG